MKLQIPVVFGSRHTATTLPGSCGKSPGDFSRFGRNNSSRESTNEILNGYKPKTKKI